MTKYKEIFKKMVGENEILFNEFRQIHDKYALDQDNLQNEFNEVGKGVMKVIRQYEDRLCNRSEGNGYAVFTGNLAKKFMDEIRKHFPQIDRVGIITQTKEFSLKKIILS